MNIYRHAFALKCPVNGEQIIYQLVIESAKVIMAEDIVKEVRHNKAELHEALADRLFSVFGERQTISATHPGAHSVHIETRRGF